MARDASVEKLPPLQKGESLRGGRGGFNGQVVPGAFEVLAAF